MIIINDCVIDRLAKHIADTCGCGMREKYYKIAEKSLEYFNEMISSDPEIGRVTPVSMATKIIEGLQMHEKSNDVILISHFMEVAEEKDRGRVVSLKHTGRESIIIRVNGGDREQERKFINSPS